jgi:dihydrofolate reductase
MKVALIVAAASNNVIGRDNQLPWHLPQDLKYFKAKTLGKPVIMGRKTYESIGRPLPGRPNIVVTRNQAWSAEGVSVVTSLADALVLARQLMAHQDEQLQEAMVIGGAEIYRSALPLADRIYLTRIELQVDGDAYFPSLNQQEWRETSRLPGEEDGAVPHSFLVYERVVQETLANN